jgi:hypothetical protein
VRGLFEQESMVVRPITVFLFQVAPTAHVSNYPIGREAFNQS